MRKESILEIREIESGEQTVCANLYANAWNVALPNSQRAISALEFEGETKGEQILVAVLNKKIVGYISICQQSWFIHHLYVDPLIQGIGIGTALISHLQGLETSMTLSLKCQLANSKAIGFYKALGFIESSEFGVDEYGDWVRLINTQPN